MRTLRRARFGVLLVIILALASACASMRPADPELRVKQTFDAFLSQYNETTGFYDELYRQRLLPQKEYDAFAKTRLTAQPSVDLLYLAYKRGESVDGREEFAKVRRDMAIYIIRYLEAKK